MEFPGASIFPTNPYEINDPYLPIQTNPYMVRMNPISVAQANPYNPYLAIPTNYFGNYLVADYQNNPFAVQLSFATYNQYAPITTTVIEHTVCIQKEEPQVDEKFVELELKHVN